MEVPWLPGAAITRELAVAPAGQPDKVEHARRGGGLDPHQGRRAPCGRTRIADGFAQVDRVHAVYRADAVRGAPADALLAHGHVHGGAVVVHVGLAQLDPRGVAIASFRTVVFGAGHDEEPQRTPVVHEFRLTVRPVREPVALGQRLAAARFDEAGQAPPLLRGGGRVREVEVEGVVVGERPGAQPREGKEQGDKVRRQALVGRPRQRRSAVCSKALSGRPMS